MQANTRINHQINAREVRVIGHDGANLGVLPTSEALRRANEQGLDLIEISPEAHPPVVRMMEYGKFKYLESKRIQKAKAKGKATETKTIQIKIATGDHDLELKAKKAAEFLKEGHRVKVELFLSGRAKYLDQAFLRTRLDRVLHLIPESYTMAGDVRKGPKGLIALLEKKAA